MRRVSNIAVCLFCAQLLLPASVPAQAEKEHSRPKLVVVLVVDQLRADYLEKYSEHWTGGLRRLLAEGAWLLQTRYPLPRTPPRQGHRPITPGRLPAPHGNIREPMLGPESRKNVTSPQDTPA